MRPNTLGSLFGIHFAQRVRVLRAVVCCRLLKPVPVTRSPIHLLTPTMRSVIERMHRARRTPLHSLSPEEARQAYALGAGVLELPVPPLDRVQGLQIPTRDGQLLGARLFSPFTTESGVCPPALVYFHGGGFTVGSSATHEVLCRELARLSACAVVSVDYRLAPEHRFPTAVHDAFDALQWVHQQRAVLALSADQPLAVGGDSAGGTLAAVCALLARDAGLPLALQLLFYPGTGAHPNTDSHRRFAQGFVLDQASIHYFFNHYIDLDQRDHWWFAPLLAPDLEGVAPAWLGLAECDPLVDEGVAYADQLRMAGVPVDLEIYPGVVHEFIKMGRAVPEARLAHAHAAQALRRCF